MEKIVEIICIANGLTKEELLSRNQCEYTADARFQVYALCRQVLRKENTLQKIGHYFGRNHSTIIHGLRRHADLYEQDRYYRNCYNDAIRLYEDWLNGYITEQKEQEIDTPYGKRKATIIIRYNKCE